MLTSYAVPGAQAEFSVAPAEFRTAAYTAGTGEALSLDAPLRTAAFTKTEYSLGGIDLSYAQTFEICRPESKMTVTTSTFYITGTSDPAYPLYCGDTEVPQTSTGLWGILVQVPVGTNYYTFTQNGVEKTACLVRYGATSPSTVTNISAMTPATSGYVRVGETYKLTCVAPSGSQVSASVGGYNVPMTQAAAASAGIPATFTGSLNIGSSTVGTEETVSLGNVTYTLSYGGTTKNFTSAGTMYAVGSDAYVVVEVTDYMIGITKDATPQNAGNFITTVDRGARDYVSGQTATHYELYSGGAVLKESVKVLTGTPTAWSNVSGYSYSSSGNTEIFRIKGAGRAFTYVGMDDKEFVVYLENVSAESGSVENSSSIFSSVNAVHTENNALRITFTLSHPGSLWGYRTEHSGDDLIVYCNRVPRISSSDSPLSGITVVLDPGHGGSDPGALGPTYTKGPDEADINMALTSATKQALEELGAKVVLTRSSRKQNKNVLLDRMELSDNANPDFFISIHHNSTAMSIDSSKSSGTEVYYYTGHSSKLAENIANKVSAAASRPNRGKKWSYYVVTKLTACPAVLAEIGFMVNPWEYEQITNAQVIRQTADAIANSVLATLQQSAQSY